MTIKITMLGAAAVAAAALFGNTANAAPAFAPTGAVAGVETSAVEPVARRCWWHRGHRHCKYYRYRHRRDRVYGYPEIYPHGSTNWWHEMDRQERGGRR